MLLQKIITRLKDLKDEKIVVFCVDREIDQTQVWTRNVDLGDILTMIAYLSQAYSVDLPRLAAIVKAKGGEPFFTPPGKN